MAPRAVRAARSVVTTALAYANQGQAMARTAASDVTSAMSTVHCASDAKQPLSAT